MCSSPQLFAAYHVFHRLLVPRHPPCALSSLTCCNDVPITAACIALHAFESFPTHCYCFGCLLVYPHFLSGHLSMNLLDFRYFQDFLSVFGFQGTFLTEFYQSFKTRNLSDLESLVKPVYQKLQSLFSFNPAATCSPMPSPA